MKTLRALYRFIILFFATIGIYSIWFVFSFLIPNKQYWRQFILGLWSRAWVRINRIDIEVIGKPPEPPFFLVSNHLGYIDIPVVRSVAKGVFVAKHEIGNWWAFGKMIRNMGTIYVDRERRRSIPRAGGEVIERLNSGEGVIVFPEGTSSKGEDILPFNSSFLEFASKTDIPVSYLSLTYRTPDGEPPPSESVCWWDETPLLAHILRVLALPRFTAILSFGDDLVVNPDRKELAAELRSKVSERFIPMI